MSVFPLGPSGATTTSVGPSPTKIGMQTGSAPANSTSTSGGGSTAMELSASIVLGELVTARCIVYIVISV